MPTSFNNTGVTEIPAAKATRIPTAASFVRLPTSVGDQLIIRRFIPDWRAFPMGALTFNPAYG